MVPSLPSFIIRRILKKGPLHSLAGIREVSLTGKIVRRTRGICTLFDSFSGIHIYTNNTAHQEEIDRSIEESYLVNVECSLERMPRARLTVKKIRPAVFSEEMYHTIESIAYWKKIQSQKQPK